MSYRIQKTLHLVVCLTLILLGYLHFGLNTSLAEDKLTKTPNHLYICTFNIYILGNVADKYDAVEEEYEGEVDSETPERIKNLARVLTVENFDLIVIQELTAGERGEWVLSDLAKELNQNLGGNYRHFISGPIGRGFKITEAVGFLYNPNVVNPEIIPGTTSLVQSLSVPWDKPGADPRDFIRTQWVAGDFDFTLYSVHLEYGNEEKRDAWCELVEEILTTQIPSSYSTDPDIIVLGDFNRFGKHDSILKMKYDPSKFITPNVTYFDPGFNKVKQVPKAAVKDKVGLNNNPQLLSTTVASNKYVFDIIFMTKDADEEYPGTTDSSVYGKDFGIIHFDETDGFGYQTGADQLAHPQLKDAYSDHRPLWMRFMTNAGQKDGTNGVSSASGIYVATKYGKKFHLRGCRTIKGKEIFKTWASRDEALQTYAPCGVCKP